MRDDAQPPSQLRTPEGLVAVAFLQLIRMMDGVREFVQGDDGQVVPFEPVIQLGLARVPVIPAERIAAFRLADAADGDRAPGDDDSLGHRRWSRNDPTDDLVVANVAVVVLRQQPIEPDPRGRIALRELDHARCEAVRVGLFHAALLAAFAEVAQPDDAFEESLDQLLSLQVRPELDPIVIQVDTSELAPVEHSRAIEDFDAQLVWPERDMRRQLPVPRRAATQRSDCLSDG